MLFNSLTFLVYFLPASYLLFRLGAKHGQTQTVCAILLAVSLGFYSWWSFRDLGIFITSVSFNFLIGQEIQNSASDHLKKWLLRFGVALNLMLLGYFKYVGFFVGNFNALFGANLTAPAWLLPLGISFYTFQQIAFLADARHSRTSESNPIRYALVFAFFPHLVAGPIVRYADLRPQFERKEFLAWNLKNINWGLCLFILGLAKKVLLADQMAKYASPVFAEAYAGGSVSIFEAWGGSLAYTFQLYFDFSGYSDMAIGLAALFNIELPRNFFSPYKASSIIDFWRRWHMTLSHFLRDFLYIPLGGSRFGFTRQLGALMMTMLLGGLWHGANWTFVAWGGLHGAFLICNHLWRKISSEEFRKSQAWTPIAYVLTFLLVNFAWVVFRAANFATAARMIGAMLDFRRLALPEQFLNGAAKLHVPLTQFGFTGGATLLSLEQIRWIAISGIICWCFKNAHDLTNQLQTMWKPRYALLMGVLFAYCMLQLNGFSEFIYFQF